MSQISKQIMNIAICGQPSSGKSSLLNAFSTFFISSSSKNRDTFRPTLYELRTDGQESNGLLISQQVNIIKSKDKEEFEKLRKTPTVRGNNKTEEKLSSINRDNKNKPIKSFIDANIVDFPGFGDIEGYSEDGKTDFFLETFINNMSQFDLILFVCDSNSPFLSKEQTTIYKRIREQMKKNLEETHTYSELFIVATKYDCEDEEVDEMWKDKHKFLNINEKDIFFVSNYQMFVSYMNKNIILPEKCKQEFINMYKHICGSKKRVPAFVYDKIIKKQQFISDIDAEIQNKGELKENKLTDRLINFNKNLISNRSGPKYKKLTEMIKTICETMCPFDMIRYSETKIFENLGKGKGVTQDNIAYLKRKFTNRQISPYKNLNDEVHDKLLITILFKSMFTNNEPFVIDNSIKSDVNVILSKNKSTSIINYLNELVFKKIENYIFETRISQLHYKAYIKNLEQNIINTKCIITKQFLNYLLNNELSINNKLFNTKYIIHLTNKISKDINYVILLKNEIEDRKFKVENCLTKYQIYKMMEVIYSRKPNDHINIPLAEFKYDKEYSMIIKLMPHTFDNIRMIKYISPTKYQEIKSALSQELFNKLEYYLSDITEHKLTNVVPQILKTIKPITF